MQFLAPTNVFEGVVQLNSAPTADSHAVTKSYLEANAVVGIATDSANYAELVTENGEKKLKLKPLTITDVAVDTSATSLSAWITANYSNGDEKQEGDIIVLTAVSGRAQTFIHNGGTAGTADDFAEIEGADVTDAEIRGALSGSSGIDYNSATGAFTADQGEIRGFFSNGSGLSYDSSNGVFSLNVDADGIPEAANPTNKYFTVARAQAAISVSGDGLGYTNGVLSLTADTGDIAENGNLYFTEQRVIDTLGVATAPANDVQLATFSAQGDISVLASAVIDLFGVSGSGLSFSDGDYSLDANTDLIPESANPTNKYFTVARAQAAISVSGNGLGYTNGVLSLTADTDDITEQSGAVNKFFTDARARGAISADADSGNLAQYDSSTGEILVDRGDFRATFAPQNLTANTWQTLNHGLGEKLVHCSAYDSSGNKVQVEVQLTDSNNLRVRSVINVTGAEIVVSI
jgi:hypothetical protein